jgi:hypothetical protein
VSSDKIGKRGDRGDDQHVEPTHKLFEDYKEAERKYRRAMQEVADRVGLPVVRASKQASVIRSKRAAVYEPRLDDDWSSLM